MEDLADAGDIDALMAEHDWLFGDLGQSTGSTLTRRAGAGIRSVSSGLGSSEVHVSIRAATVAETSAETAAGESASLLGGGAETAVEVAASSGVGIFAETTGAALVAGAAAVAGAITAVALAVYIGYEVGTMLANEIIDVIGSSMLGMDWRNLSFSVNWFHTCNPAYKEYYVQESTFNPAGEGEYIQANFNSGKCVVFCNVSATVTPDSGVIGLSDNTKRSRQLYLVDDRIEGKDSKEPEFLIAVHKRNDQVEYTLNPFTAQNPKGYLALKKIIPQPSTTDSPPPTYALDFDASVLTKGQEVNLVFILYGIAFTQMRGPGIGPTWRTRNFSKDVDIHDGILYVPTDEEVRQAAQRAAAVLAERAAVAAAAAAEAERLAKIAAEGTGTSHYIILLVAHTILISNLTLCLSIKTNKPLLTLVLPRVRLVVVLLQLLLVVLRLWELLRLVLLLLLLVVVLLLLLVVVLRLLVVVVVMVVKQVFLKYLYRFLVPSQTILL
jgi:hypothetical protein